MRGPRSMGDIDREPLARAVVRSPLRPVPSAGGALAPSVAAAVVRAGRTTGARHSLNLKVTLSVEPASNEGRSMLVKVNDDSPIADSAGCAIGMALASCWVGERLATRAMIASSWRTCSSSSSG